MTSKDNLANANPVRPISFCTALTEAVVPPYEKTRFEAHLVAQSIVKPDRAPSLEKP